METNNNIPEQTMEGDVMNQPMTIEEMRSRQVDIQKETAKKLKNPEFADMVGGDRYGSLPNIQGHTFRPDENLKEIEGRNLIAEDSESLQSLKEQLEIINNFLIKYQKDGNEEDYSNAFLLAATIADDNQIIINKRMKNLSLNCSTSLEDCLITNMIPTFEKFKKEDQKILFGNENL